MELRINIERSKLGIPCLWESGGCRFDDDMFALFGAAQIITGPNGEKKTAEFVESGLNEACGNHALIPISVGDCVIQVAECLDITLVTMYKIISIDDEFVENRCCTAEKIEENSTAARLLEPALAAALEKANTLYCRKAMYIKEIS